VGVKKQDNDDHEATIAVTIESLDKVYCCMECRAVYLFQSDVLDHQQQTKHEKKFYEVPLT